MDPVQLLPVYEAYAPLVTTAVAAKVRVCELLPWAQYSHLGYGRP